VQQPATVPPWPGHRGLSAAEVADRVSRHQVNRSPRSDAADYRDILLRNLATLFNALVVPAAVALFFLGRYNGAWAVSGMAVVNTLLGLVQEVRAKRHLDRLAILTENRARVLRGGVVQVVPASTVVLDDLLLLSPGDMVAADGAVVAARFFEVDEALLTGESDPVAHQPGERLLSGSICVAGEALYRAEQVGGASFANRTAAEARQYRFAASPLQRSINLLIRILTGLTLALCLLYVILWFVRGFSPATLAEMTAATVTSMVPQGLVLMTTLAFILGAVRMSRRGAVVQRLDAVESMAAINVLCMDKTGTLTSNRLRLALLRLLPPTRTEENVRGQLAVFAWSSIDHQSKSIQALRAALPRPGPELELVDQLPFKSQNRFSAVRVREGQREQILVLGAYEALQPNLHRTEVLETTWQEHRSDGLRLLLFAEALGANGAEDAAMLSHFHGSLEGLRLQPLALVGLSDELRPEAAAVLEALAGQGIRFKVISGDSPETVRATVAALSLGTAGTVVSGDQLASASDQDSFIEAGTVFGRVTPRQKVEIVTALQRGGSRVAMIGDGINDILPIKRADLGIAMGEGAAATRTAAGLVLETNDFGLLPATLDEGRLILRNLRCAGKLFLLKNVYTLFLIVFALGVLGLPFPYLPQQVTLLNTLTIGIPAFFIMLSRQRAGPSRGDFVREIGTFALAAGLIVGVAGLAVLLLSAWCLGDDPQTQRTLLLSTLILMGLASLLRALPAWNSWLALWPTPALAVYGLVMYWPLTAAFFELTPLAGGQWGLVLAVALPAAAVLLLTPDSWLIRGPHFR
jgi:cation-transporting ATPase E